ncbi:hypothetical protein CC80DRAFT_556495 [Byssothecium circinans]|uniref:F-box domain-containing protein n=1 Tax=Byssothecium circinans TaxID=147558 RepID=A0A6A5T5N7_9PLEO|nr:hypothetical protein CC80DRAFT_556495 [Byssothecium circinans]
MTLLTAFSGLRLEMLPQPNTHNHPATSAAPAAPETNNTNLSSIVAQPNSRLLSLPPELRLEIYEYMNLSPEAPDHLQWLGGYFTCRQLQSEIRDHLKPEESLEVYTNLTCPWHQDIPVVILPAPSFEQFGLVQELTVRIPIPRISSTFCCSRVLITLYALYLNNLNVVFTGDIKHRLPYGDLKSVKSEFFLDAVERGLVNCKAVTFTLDFLANIEDGRVKTVKLENELKKSRVVYSLVITQDKKDQQSERTYSSASRFKPMAIDSD